MNFFFPRTNPSIPSAGGVSERDVTALVAMHAIVSQAGAREVIDCPDALSCMAYRMADAMKKASGT